MKEPILKWIIEGCTLNCRFHFEAVVGEDTDHGNLPRLASSPARDNLE